MDGQLPFLDSFITSVNNCFISDIYRKSTFSGLGLSFLYISFRFKINSIQTLLHSEYKVTFNFVCFHKEITFMKNVFTQNCYPSKSILQSVNFLIPNSTQLLPPILKDHSPFPSLFWLSV